MWHQCSEDYARVGDGGVAGREVFEQLGLQRVGDGAGGGGGVAVREVFEQLGLQRVGDGGCCREVFGQLGL